MRIGKLARAGAVIVGGLTLAIGTWAGVAAAVSGGPYSSPQQDCPWYGSGWNTPQDQTYPGCHNAQVSAESGGTTNGNADNGWNDSPTPGDHGKTNTTWVQYGNDQGPNDSESKGTPTELSVPYPGQSDAYHAGCLSVNTDGTDGGAVPEGNNTYDSGYNGGNTAPESPSKANSQDKYGCGNNPNGAGFSATYDYYNLYDGYGYCTVGKYFDQLEGGDPCGQMANGQSDAGSTTLTPDTGSQQSVTDILTQGLIVYFGMDDNVDNGEHDGEGPFTSPMTDGAVDGPSDGGGLLVSFTPQTATDTPSATNPEGLFNISLGFCADGNCGNGTTQQETVWNGCDANTGENHADDQCTGSNKAGSSRDAANYTGTQWDPYNCSSGGQQPVSKNQPEADSPHNCDSSSANPSPSGTTNSSGGEDYWRQQEPTNVNAEPGVQFYEDPDPEGSPATPIYPNPGVYAGTCGVIVGAGGTSSAGDPTGQLPTKSLALPPGTPATNKAGQLDVDPTGC